MAQITIAQIPLAVRQQLQRLADRPLAEQAMRLDLARTTIKTYRSALIRAGLLQPRARQATPEDIARMRRLADQGLSLAGIAERIGISTEQCWRVMRREGIARGREVWNLGAIARLFDVSRDATEQWRDAGWLTLTPARGDEFQRGIPQRATRADLVRFVHERAAWPSYSPSRIADSALCELAEAARRHAGGAWVPLADVAERAGIVAHAVRKRATTTDWLAGWEWTQIGRAWYLWWPNGATLPPYTPRDAWETRRARQARRAA